MMIFSSLLMFTEVICRYLIGKSLGWSEELLRYLLIWMTFLGSYLALKEDEHLRISMFFDRLPSRWRVPIKWLADLLTIVFFIVFTVLSIKYAIRFWSDVSPLLEIPLGLIYSVMAIGGVLLIFQAVLTNLYQDRSKGSHRS